MLTVTKIFRFCYGHHLPDYEGKCKNFHGHNCRLEITVREPRIHPHDNYPGMVMDFGDLKKIVTPIIEELDHKNLNEILPAAFIPPTAENIAMFFVFRLNNIKVLNGRLVRVRVYETDDSYATWEWETL